MNEAQLQQRILDTAKVYGWRAAHHRPARTTHGWRTPIQGDPGVPDLLLARNGVVIAAELKAEKGRPTVDQTGWLCALGAHGRLWKPRDWADILEELGGAA